MDLPTAEVSFGAALAVLQVRGFSISRDSDCDKGRDTNGWGFWKAEKDGSCLSAMNPVELLGLVVVWEQLGEKWQDARPSVRGLPVPRLLVQLIAEGRWRCPDINVIRRVLPMDTKELEMFVDDVDDEAIGIDLDFMTSFDSMAAEGSSFFEKPQPWLYLYDGDRVNERRELPWLDATRTFCIAVCGDFCTDFAIALDFRTSNDDPRVVATDWSDGGCHWREVAATFSEFVRLLEL